MTYLVLHGPDDQPSQASAETLGAAARLAAAFARERRRHVRVRLPDGRTMDFDRFQDAVFDGSLRDEDG